MQTTPKGFRLHIGLFGRRNVGKSSLLNALTRQSVSIVSDVAGTTTDPVDKAMELQPIGPVLFIDTAGVDDVGALGEMRIRRTRQVFDRTDVGIIVAAAGQWSAFEEAILEELLTRGIPVIVVFNKSDLARTDAPLLERLKALKLPCVHTSARNGEGLADLREALIRSVPDDFIKTPPIVGDLIPPGELSVLVVPIDKEAPKGRLILPQVQTIRDVLDHDACCMVVKDRDLQGALARLREPPALVVTDSQAFLEVAAVTPDSVPMTSFSILFARIKGDLTELVRGTLAIDRLQPGDHVLICETCTHHPIEEDIGREKIRPHRGGSRTDRLQRRRLLCLVVQRCGQDLQGCGHHAGLQGGEDRFRRKLRLLWRHPGLRREPDPGGERGNRHRQANHQHPRLPPHPDWIVWAVAQILLNKSVALDSVGRPTALFGLKLHENCPRKEQDEVNRFGLSSGCLKPLGCKGPETKSNCSTLKWHNGVNWCVGAGAPCIGCTEPTFPIATPFYKNV